MPKGNEELYHKASNQWTVRGMPGREKKSRTTSLMHQREKALNSRDYWKAQSIRSAKLGEYSFQALASHRSSKAGKRYDKLGRTLSNISAGYEKLVKTYPNRLSDK
tara:strand:- start:1830 stop:2147 length:318 start_codon:yes stop_codon:yes gene_type:complete